ncbi:MAG: hypothetical protein QM831_23675 [Kofleriaceae bacterium]
MIPADVRSLPMRGKFEAHVTVESGDLEALCTELGIGFIGIELASGAHASQPMTASHHEGELATVVDEVNALVAKIGGAGFMILRTKLEAAASTEGVPLTAHDGPGYFEFHVKVRPAGREQDLAERAASVGARLSRNASKQSGRFVTMRVYRVGRAEAEAKLEALLVALQGFDVTGVVSEFTVYDSRIDLDAGWLHDDGR